MWRRSNWNSGLSYMHCLSVQQRNEVKAGMNAEDLVKPLVMEEDEDPSKKVDSVCPILQNGDE